MRNYLLSMKSWLLTVCISLFAGLSVNAQTLLHDNGPVFNVTGPPQLSVLQTSLGLGTYGAGAAQSAGFTVADDFVLASASNIGHFEFYTYQTGATSVTITGVYLRIYNGSPASGGTVVWGDLTTNRLSSATLTGGYRVLDTGTSDTTRQLQLIKASTPGLNLASGTYWVEVQFAGTLASGPWAPPITITGQTTTGNALQYDPSTTSFVPLNDGTFQQGLPFRVYGPLTSCAGMPTGGTAVVTPSQGVPGTNYTVSATGYSENPGLSYQWQSNTNNAGWVNVGSATSSYAPYNATAPANMGDVVQWRLQITCTATSDIAYSTVANFTVALVYCTPTATTNDATGLTNVTFNTINNTTASTSAYSNYSTMTTTVLPGSTYNLSVLVNTAGNFTVNTKAWIDWNGNDPNFTSATAYNLGTITNNANGAPSLSPVAITVPAGQPAGSYRMRIRAVFGSTTVPVPCGNQNWSEAEDYTIVVGTMGVTDNQSNQAVQIYPNPTSDVLNVKGFNPKNVQVFDISGKRIDVKIDGNVINTSKLQTGAYVIQMTDANGNVVSRRFTKN